MCMVSIARRHASTPRSKAAADAALAKRQALSRPGRRRPVPVNVPASPPPLLFDGCRPGANNPVWACQKIRHMIWFHSSSNRVIVPSGWTLETRALSHADLGGVTNGKFRCHIACRLTTPALDWPRDPLAVQSFLNQVVDPTLGGPLTEKEPEYELRELNPASGQLDWKL